jgi:putative RNA 2'-phosphotransferase
MSDLIGLPLASPRAGLSKQLSYYLRHSPDLPKDACGWVDIEIILQIMNISKATLAKIIDEDDKRRYEICKDKIRACQGHSTASGVDVHHLEKTWVRIDTQNIILYHATRKKNVPSILAKGLLPGRRTHVHLADSENSKVGKRQNVDVLLKIDGNTLHQLKIPVYRSSNGVLLAKEIPPEAISIYPSY